MEEYGEKSTDFKYEYTLLRVKPESDVVKRGRKSGRGRRGEGALYYVDGR